MHATIGRALLLAPATALLQFDLGLRQGAASLESKMTNGEQKMFVRGVAAGTIMGMAIGLMIALFIAMKPESLAGLIR